MAISGLYDLNQRNTWTDVLGYVIKILSQTELIYFHA